MRLVGLVLGTILLCLQLHAHAQVFRSPIDYEISLAGNFGEPRPHHFHGGLDIKTDGVEGKHIYAIGDGYVSRVTCGLYGFGNAVYITHPTGHTSVYCHLKAFSPRIKAALRRYQYLHETCVADARFSPVEVPVSQGQFIALSGNTGHSTAPHLHLEVHDTRTWDMLDPYQFLDGCISDSVPPRAHAFMAIPQDPSSRFNGMSDRHIFTPQPSPATSHQMTAWGRIGFAAWADDYMQGSYNHYGIHETVLLVDGRQVFRSVVDRIPIARNRMVNSWGDYAHYRRSHAWYMKSYVEPGNTLPILRADQNRGVVDFNEERDYHLEYILRDYKGNESHYEFTVKGERPLKPLKPLMPSRGGDAPILLWNRTNSYSLPGMQLVVPYGLVAVNTPLQPSVRQCPGAYSYAYQFAGASLPLMADAELSIYARRTSTDDVVDSFDPAKLYISDENGRFMGGDYRNGWVVGHIRELAGLYALSYDDQPPTVKPISLQGNRLLLSAVDGKSGIASWTATVDGRFIVFDTIEKSTTYACELRESWLRPTSREHRLHFEVTDNCGNLQAFDTTFTY